MKSPLRPLTVVAFCTIVAYLPATARAETLSVSNGSFTNLTGLTDNGGGWYGGIPLGWSTDTTPANAYTLLLSGGAYYANLQTLGGTAPFAPLRQSVGTVDLTSDVTLIFTINSLSGVSSLGSAIYDLALAPYTSALAFTNISSISGVSTVSYTARGVSPGTALYITFWNGGNAAGLSGVSISDSATTYLWNGGVSGVWTNGGGGWTDKFDNTETNYNNAKPVVAQFTNAAAGTNVTIASDGVNVGNVVVDGGNYALSGGAITMTNTTWSVSNAVATVSGVLAGTTGLTKSGSGTLVLGASNSYSGGTTLSAGTLALSNANALGSGNLTVNGGTLDLGGNNLTAANLGGTGGTISLGANTLTASMTSGRQFDGTISGSGALVKTGASFLTLAGNNTYSGGTLVNGGTLFVIGSGTLGDAAGTITISNAVVDLRNQQTRTGTITMFGQDARLLSGDVNNPGSVVNNGSALQFGGGQITASISGTGGLNVTGGGSLNSFNSFTGATTITGTDGWYGANALFVDNAHGLGAASGSLTMSGGILSLQNNTVTRSGNLTISGGTVQTGTFSKSGSDYDIQGGAIGTVLAGTAGLTKSGAFTATLSGANTFSGALAVNAGVLGLNSASGGAAGSVSGVTVATNAVLLLSLNDQVSNTAAVTLSGGTIRRASGVSEVFGILDLEASSFLDYSGGTGGSLEFRGIDYTPSALLALQLLNFTQGSSLVIQTSTDLTSYIGTGFTFDGAGGFGGSSFNGSTFTITAIPEPSTVLAAIGLVGLMLWPTCRRQWSRARIFKRALAEKC